MDSDSPSLPLEPSDEVVDLEERALLPRHCRGDRDAFAQLLSAYKSPVYTYLIRCGVPHASRDDVFQEIFVKIHTAAHAYQPARPLSPWIFTIAANTVRNHWRNQHKHAARRTQAATDDIPDPSPGQEQVVQTEELLGWLERALVTLPFEQREVLTLISLGGFSLKNASQILHAPLSTVKTRLRRARLSLAEARASFDAEGSA